MTEVNGQTPGGRQPGSAGATECPEKAEAQVCAVAVWGIVNSFTWQMCRLDCYEVVTYNNCSDVLKWGFVDDEETELYYLRSRYYDAYKCCFINADALINGNLYAYCENSPIVHEDNNGYALCCCLDDNGFDTTLMSHFMFGGSCGGGSGSAVVGISAALGQRKSIQQRAASKGVSFKPEEDGKGGCIDNSYKLLPWEMFEYTQYLKKQYGDIYNGSDIGFYFEWAAHNLGYCAIDALNAAINLVEPLIGQEDITVAAGMQESFSDVNFGATIYDDYADHGAKSFIFFIPYEWMFPISSLYDKFVHCFNIH